jgi:phage terminase small subunit
MAKINMMTKKDISIVIEYCKDNLNSYTNRKVPIGKKTLIITLNKNKKIDPNIIYEIYKNNSNILKNNLFLL